MPIMVQKQSMLTGKLNVRTLPTTAEKLKEWEKSYPNGPLIQDFFPELSNEDREFILTGSTPDEWNAAFPEEEGE